LRDFHAPRSLSDHFFAFSLALRTIFFGRVLLATRRSAPRFGAGREQDESGRSKREGVTREEPGNLCATIDACPASLRAALSMRTRSPERSQRKNNQLKREDACVSCFAGARAICQRTSLLICASSFRRIEARHRTTLEDARASLRRSVMDAFVTA
jgi:hypothetical protein